MLFCYFVYFNIQLDEYRVFQLVHFWTTRKMRCKKFRFPQERVFYGTKERDHIVFVVFSIFDIGCFEKSFILEFSSYIRYLWSYLNGETTITLIFFRRMQWRRKIFVTFLLFLGYKPNLCVSKWNSLYIHAVYFQLFKE